MAIREIKLVDPGLLFNRHLRRHLAFWAGCLTVFLILIGGFYLFQARAVATDRSSRGSLAQLHSDLKLKIDEIQRMQAELQNLRRRQSILEAVIKKQPVYQVLAKLAEIMNESTWITQLALEAAKEGGRDTHLKLAGVAGSNNDLGNFISRLSSEPMFKAVELEFAREGETAPSSRNINASMNQIYFQISCNLN